MPGCFALGVASAGISVSSHAPGVAPETGCAGDYVALETDCHYDDLIYAAQQQLEIALGLRLARNNGEVLLNPSRNKT
jgi:hypothetical protein